MSVDVSKRPEYLGWVIGTDDYEDDWSYRKFDGYPPGDSDLKTIMAFVRDAREAEKAKAEDLIDEGKSPEEAKKLACQWPLKDNAPMEIVREFIGYQYQLQEMAKNGEEA